MPNRHKQHRNVLCDGINEQLIIAAINSIRDHEISHECTIQLYFLLFYNILNSRCIKERQWGFLRTCVRGNDSQVWLLWNDFFLGNERLHAAPRRFSSATRKVQEAVNVYRVNRCNPGWDISGLQFRTLFYLTWVQPGEDFRPILDGSACRANYIRVCEQYTYLIRLNEITLHVHTRAGRGGGTVIREHR